MEVMSLSSGSLPATKESYSTFDEFSMQQSLLFSESLKDLKSLRSQLYSAAEYFELSYTNDDKKQIMVETLKDYAVKALVNTVDHLGSASYKVNGLLNEKVEEVSEADLRVSCIEQRLRTCQEYIDRAGLSQQSLVITTPKYHKRYILPVGEVLPGSGQNAIAHETQSHLHKEGSESKIFQDEVRSTIMDRPPSFRKGRSMSPAHRARSLSPSQKMLPSRKMRSPSPSSRSRKSLLPERRLNSPFPILNSQQFNLNPLARSGSLSSGAVLSHSPSITRQFPTEMLKSSSLHFHATSDEQKEVERIPSKSKNFLKSLLNRRKTKKDDMLYTYLDEY